MNNGNAPVPESPGGGEATRRVAVQKGGGGRPAGATGLPPVPAALLDALEEAVARDAPARAPVPAAEATGPPGRPGLPGWRRERPAPPAGAGRRRGLTRRGAAVVLALGLLVILAVAAVLAGLQPAGGRPAPAGAPGPARTAAAPAAAPLPAALAPAWAAEQEGRYADAGALYRPVADARPPGPDSATARWHLAIVLFDAAQYDTAIAQFALFARTYPADPRSPQAAFWAGRAHLAAGRPAAALAEWTSYAPVAGPLRAATLQLAAEAARRLGDRDQESSLLKAALAGPATRLDRLASWARLAALADATGAPALAANWYALLAGEAHLPSYRAQMLFQGGAALLDAGQADAGERRLIGLISTLPDEPGAYQGLTRLLAADPAVLSGGRLGYDLACRTAYAAGHDDEALAYCASFRDVQAPGPARAEAAWYTARAYEAAGNAVQAIAWYGGFTAVYTADARLPDALLRWGNLLAQGGDTPGALGLYARLAAYPQSAAHAAAEDQAGLLLRRQGDFAGAAAHWLLAAAAPGAGDDLRARALFWRGWTLQQEGQSAGAAASWQQGAAYQTFWGQRCLDHLAAGTVLPRDAGPAAAADLAGVLVRLTPNPQRGPDSERVLLLWAASWSAPGRDVPAPGSVPPRLAADPEYGRALALARAQLWDQANPAFDDLAATLEARRDGPALAALALEARREGWPWLAYAVAHSLRAAATAAGQPPGVAGLPRAAQELVYPLAWPQAVAAEAQAQHVDPLLLLALVRQESAYSPAAHSPADARGLTQVVPDTAQGLAAPLHIPDFTPALLYRPAIALRFGASYLGQTLDQFDRNILYALAGYNAGPGNVPGWAGGAVNNDPDLFVDNIDYAETRAYVQIVYANYGVYRWLYAQRP